MAEDLKNCLCTVANYMSDLNKTKPMRWREKLGLFKAQFSKQFTVIKNNVNRDELVDTGVPHLVLAAVDPFAYLWSW